jgi:GTPase SAR1 family protein
MSNYKNPFAEYNSNVMSSKQISALFAEPFDLFDINATDIESEKSTILFIGGRGTGKTMLLRQFSHNVQRVSLPERTTFLDKVKSKGYVGVYFRVDNPLLKSLDSVSAFSEKTDFAKSLFIHYFELTVFKDYLEILKGLLADDSIDKTDKRYKQVLVDLKNLLPCDEEKTKDISDIDGLLRFVVDEINYIWKYQSKKAIDIDNIVVFDPVCGVLQHGKLTNEFLNTSAMEALGLKDINVLLLIDEFENFSEGQQRVLNTAMRFTKDYGAKFRIGMRPNGFKTYGTLDDADFVKEGRDYRKVEFGFPYMKKGKTQYMQLVKLIADKRLALIPQFNGMNITNILGEAEDLEVEAKAIAKDRHRLFDAYLKLINDQNNSNYTFEDLADLYHDNPLYEIENLRLLLSGESLGTVKKAFNNYLNKVKSSESDKYSNDYTKKYKMTFVFVLCSIYHVEKKWYYSFTDFCQLSSGIVGCFIDLCRRAFDIAYFREREALFKGKISSAIQTDAAYEYAQAEREMIKRINIYGSKLIVFIDNIGNAFGYIHKDMFMRYPETNSFPVALNSLSEENQKLLDVACTWSLLVKKPNTQDTKAIGQKREVYFLNRVLAPVFKFSYRTRGGLNPVTVTDNYFSNSFRPQDILSNKNKKGSKAQGGQQMTLFPDFDINTNANDAASGTDKFALDDIED